MNSLKKCHKYMTRLFHFIPTALPIGITEFDKWAKDIIDTYGFPDNDSIKFSMAVMILHLSATTAYKPKRYFALATLKGMSNQVVSQVIQDLKAKQQAEADKAKEAQSISSPSASDDTKITS